jgi:hypothetical protein
MYRHTFRPARLVGGLAVLGLLLVVPASPAAAVKSVKATVTVSDDFSSGSIRFVVDGIPDVVPAGTYKVEFVNNSIGPHVLIGVGGLPPGTTTEEFLELIRANPGGPPPGIFETGAVFAKPGQRHQKVNDLTEPGTYGYLCPIPTPAGVPHFELGFVGVFEVVA